MAYIRCRKYKMKTKNPNFSPLQNFLLIFSILFFVSIFILSPNILSQEIFEYNGEEVAVCDEQLQICVDEFNSLLADFRNGTNCNSKTFNQLKKMNSQVSNDRDTYKQQMEDLKIYKISFFIVTGLLVLWIIFFLINIFRNKPEKQRNLIKNAKKKL